MALDLDYTSIINNTVGVVGGIISGQIGDTGGGVYIGHPPFNPAPAPTPPQSSNGGGIDTNIILLGIAALILLRK